MNNNLFIVESSLKNNETISKYWKYNYDSNHDNKSNSEKQQILAITLVITITKTKDTLQ